MKGMTVQLYDWPDSQICMDCFYGEFVTSDTLTNSNYLCLANCNENNGSICPKFLAKDEEDSEENQLSETPG